jgi:hypothetical protein
MNTRNTQAQPEPTPRATAGRQRGLRFTTFGLAVAALGLLLWARFLIVTNHPRTAIAEPVKEAAPAGKDNHDPKVVVEAGQAESGSPLR